MHLKAD